MPSVLPRLLRATLPVLPRLLFLPLRQACCLPPDLLRERVTAGLPASSTSVPPLVSRPPPRARRRWCRSPRQASPLPASSTTTPSPVSLTPPRARSVLVPHARHALDVATSLENTRMRENTEGRGCCSRPHTFHGALRESLEFKQCLSPP
jgi:hypothetical protein